MYLEEGDTFTDIIGQQTYYVVWERELSRLIGEHYGKPYRIQQQGDCMANDSYFTVEVGPEMECDLDWDKYGWSDDWDSEQFAEAIIRAIADWQASECPEEKKHTGYGTPSPVEADGYTWVERMWWEREGYLDYRALLWDLNRQGLIPTGDYLVTVCW